MRTFIDQDFLLETETAKALYHGFAKNLPIIDYHCHINPREIYENRRFNNLTQAWLEADHYKWRAIRSNGITEEQITGATDEYEKFKHFAAVMPKLIGNPLYHWTHLELKRYLNIDTPLSGETVEEVWNLSLDRLPKMSVREIIQKSNVEVIGTTDDPIDSLEWHIALRNDPTFNVTVIPSFRPDKAVNICKPGFAAYIKTLGDAAGITIDSLDDLYAALSARLDFFVSLGCRASDHGLDTVVYHPAPEGQADEIFKRALSGHSIDSIEADIYQTNLMVFLGKELYKHNLVMQLHYGAQRNANTRMFEHLGPDSGFDCICANKSCNLAGFLNALEQLGQLPKTILYSLDPSDNAMLDTVIGCFQGSEAASKLQHGSAWWFNDTKQGMEQQLTTLASLSALGNFVGMLTDSRSFLSYTRHEYFRRILCNLLGKWVENGEYTNDMTALKILVSDISYNNAKRYFNL